MSQQYVPNLGELAGEDARRDAVHIAVAPVIAGERLGSGQRVGFLKNGRMAGTCYEFEEVVAIGVVDPFFSNDIVEEGERFWLFLFPNTVTSLRHVWTHPAFQAKPLATEGGDA